MPVLPDAPVTQAEFQDFRGEVKAEFASVRSEFRSEFATIRNELRDYQARVFAYFDKKFEGIDQKFKAVDRRFVEVNGSFDKVDSRLTLLEHEYQSIKVGLKRVEGALTRRSTKKRS